MKNVPGFNAEASLHVRTDYYAAMNNSINANEGGIGLASFGDFARFRVPLPLPFLPDACNACISDCVHRGGNSFSCRNLCSFLCD